MMVGWLALLGTLVSVACIALLAATDPRRARIAAPSVVRRLLALATIAPGLAFAITGRWADFLVWIGSAAVIGWAIAALVNLGTPSREKH